MKVAYLSASTIPSNYANSVHVMKMCQAFVKNGHEVVLYARKSGEQVEDEHRYYGVEHCFDIEKQSWLPLRYAGGLLYGIQVRKKVLRNPLPDIFYGRDLYSLLAVASIGCPLIYEAHAPPENRVRQYLETRLLNSPNFRHLVVISNALRSEYLRLFPKLEESRVVVAHDGADLPESLEIERKSFVLPGREGCIQVGYVGSLYPGKGMEVVVQLPARLPELDFHVVGGTQGSIERWKTHIEVKNFFFHGFIPHGLLGKYYHSLDILLAPYQNRVTLTTKGKGDISKWMSPLKIFEYMAHAKAIVASDLPVLKEVLCHEVNSLLCPPQDIEAWQNALLELANNSSLRTALGDTARQEFVKRYTWKGRGEVVHAPFHT